VPPARTKFSLLSQTPQPLPDDDEPAAAAEASKPAGEGRQARARAASKPAQAPRPRGATTVRLRPPAADALSEAWLDERQQTDPKLSYPEFASMIVLRGLADYKRERRGKPA
jgi:hypothetical protein